VKPASNIVSIRPSTPADVPQILQFIRDLASFEREPDAVVASEALIHKALFEERSAEALIAEINGGPVGFALFFHTFSTWTGRKGIWLEDLYVDPPARRRGVAKALLQHIARLALERNCARFEWSVLDWNEDAIAVYRKLGAVGMDEWRIQRVSGEALERLAAGDA
jgi:GNAT superfamily N-acetyltransferase